MSSIKLYTEKDKITNDHYQIYRLAQLAQNDRSTFEQIADYLPYPVHQNKVSNLEYTFQNKQIAQILKNDYDKLLEFGHRYILQIAEPRVHERVIRSIKTYTNYGDRQSVLTYFQCLKIEGKYTWIYTHKIFSGSSLFLNISHPLENMGQLGVTIQNILGETFIKRNGWLLFDSLTKREKEILRLLVDGHTSNEISEQLFISKHTTDTHKRNIYHKLEVKNLATLIKFSQAFDLIEL